MAKTKIKLGKRTFTCDFSSSVVFQVLGAFVITEAIAFAAGYKLMRSAVEHAPSLPSLWEFMIAMLVATAFIFGAIRFIRGRLVFELFFALALFIGAWIVFSSFLAGTFAVILALVSVLLKYFRPTILFHNAAIIIGVAGIGASLGLTFSWKAAILILVIFSVYDVIAVYKTKHMVTMFRDLARRGVVFALIIPSRLKDLYTDARKVKSGGSVMFLGTGDLALPSLFVVSALGHSLGAAMGAGIGGAFGLFLMHSIFVCQPKRAPMPALPPIALGAILGFVIAVLAQLIFK